MSLYSRLMKRQRRGQAINVAVAGAGLIGRGMVRQIDRTPGMRTAMIINRSISRAVESFVQGGRTRSEIEVTDDPARIQDLIGRERAVVTTCPDVLRSVRGIDAVVEVTGAVTHGARVAMCAIEGGKHIIMMNAETDATVGCALKRRADAAGVVYTNSDGDQPGVLKRLYDHVGGIGFEVLAAMNCKDFLDVHATPESTRPWAEKQGTSLAMTTAFADGTKMNIENAVLANATGLMPDQRGMHGIRTTLADALDDCIVAFRRRGVVDYTLGGDFAGGVFVIGSGEKRPEDQPYMRYLKMGRGPFYMFYRPYHLCHFETPLSIAEAVLDLEPTIAPLDKPVVEVITTAKQCLEPGDVLDGIGGYTCYGEIELVDQAMDLLPVGLAEDVVVTRSLARDEPIPLDAVELDGTSLLARLRREQERETRTLPRIARAA